MITTHKGWTNNQHQESSKQQVQEIKILDKKDKAKLYSYKVQGQLQDALKKQDNKQQKRIFSVPCLLLYFLISLIGVGVVVCIFDFYHFYKYIQISSRIKNNEQVEENMLLYHLEFLTWRSMPYNDYFFEEKIFELGKAKNWDKLIVQANKALQYSYNSGKFSIHYHKAMALCFRERFQQCKQATLQAQRYATRQNFYYLNDIYSILISNNQILPHQVPAANNFIKEPQKIPKKGIEIPKSKEELQLQYL